MKPTAPPPRAGPHPGRRLAHAWRSVRGERHGRLQPAFAQLPPPLQTPRITCTLGGREGQEHLAASPPEAPNAQAPGLPPPAAPRLLERSNQQRGHGIATAVPRPQGFLRVGPALGASADRTLRDDALAQRFFPGALAVALGHPARLPRDAPTGQPIPRPAQRRPPCRTRGGAEPAPWGELAPEHACGGLHGAVRRAMALPLGRWPPRVAAAAEDLGLFWLQSCLEHAFRGQPDQRTQQLLATGRVARSRQPRGPLWCLLLPRRSLSGHTGGSFFWVMQRSHITLTVPAKGRSS
jgi:hypothetical protein